MVESVAVVELLPQTGRWVVVLNAACPSAVGAAPAAEGSFRPVSTGAALRSSMPDAPSDPVCDETVKSAQLDVVLFAPPATIIAALEKLEPAVTTFAANTPLSVRVQVVEAVTQSTKSPVTGAEANNLMVFDAVAALARVEVKLPLAGNSDSVPAVPDKPSVGVNVSAGVAPAMISPAEPTRSSVVFEEVPPMLNVLFGDVIVSPPLPPLLGNLTVNQCPGAVVAS